jgi:polysaccharide pyruvyl transferase WcaK-like protein
MPSYPHKYNQQMLSDLDNLDLLRLSQARRAFRFLSRKLGMQNLQNKLNNYNPKEISKCDCLLSVGGDVYSWSLGEGTLPGNWVVQGEYCYKHNIPHVLWGATIGPFKIHEAILDFVINHFKKSALILARDQMTINYLAGYGIEQNVKLVADPAYLLDVTPFDVLPYFPTDRGRAVLGFNCSGLASTYAMDPKLLQSEIVKTIRYVVKDLDMSVILVPHVVTAQDTLAGGDVHYLGQIHNILKDELKARLGFLNKGLGAQRHKYLISKCDFFAGARMHSTIAGFSSKVPTIGLAYSVKAEGMGEEVYGHRDYVIKMADYTAEAFSNKLKDMINREKEIHEYFDRRIPEMQIMAMKAGEYLKQVMTK